MNIIEQLFEMTGENVSKEDIKVSVELEPGIVLDRIEEFDIPREKKDELIQGVLTYQKSEMLTKQFHNLEILQATDLVQKYMKGENEDDINWLAKIILKLQTDTNEKIENIMMLLIQPCWYIDHDRPEISQVRISDIKKVQYEALLSFVKNSSMEKSDLLLGLLAAFEKSSNN